MTPAITPPPMSSLPWDIETIRAVAVRFRTVMRETRQHWRAKDAAEAVMRERHPEVPADDLWYVVSEIISAVAHEHRAWFYELDRE